MIHNNLLSQQQQLHQRHTNNKFLTNKASTTASALAAASIRLSLFLLLIHHPPPSVVASSSFLLNSSRSNHRHNHRKYNYFARSRYSCDPIFKVNTRRNMSSDNNNNDNKQPLVIAQALDMVRDRIQQLDPQKMVRLVAVSKTKPVEMLMECYDAGQRRFGENYVQELIQKAQVMPKDIEWHFIGPLQSNKAALLVKQVGASLAVVETVSTMKLARKLNRAAEDVNADVCQRRESDSESDDKYKYQLGVYIQVNTSGEASKSGVGVGDEAIALAKGIVEECPYLSFQGVMTIGAPGDYSCFDKLVACRKAVARAIGNGMEDSDLELSMGMSGDYEEAIRRGATNVRVGSTIFGARDYINSKKL